MRNRRNWDEGNDGRESLRPDSRKKRNMDKRKTGFKLAVLLLIAAIPDARALDGAEAHTVPATVFVGDRATLIVPVLDFPGLGDVEMPAALIPESPNIDIHRVALERRPGGNRLAVEFAAFAPGVLELPPLEIAGTVFSGLTVEIASVLEAGEIPVLSPPAGPLAVPGTALLVYGTVAALVFLLLLVSAVSLKGHVWLKNLAAAWKRRRMLRLMLGVEKRLRKALAGGSPPRAVLDELSGEFRGFLSDLTGENCRAMTAGEIGRLAAARGETPADGGPSGDTDSAPPYPPFGAAFRFPDGGFPERFFAAGDRARFSGRPVDGGEISAAMDELREFLLALKAAPAGAGANREGGVPAAGETPAEAGAA